MARHFSVRAMVCPHILHVIPYSFAFQRFYEALIILTLLVSMSLVVLLNIFPSKTLLNAYFKQ